MMKTAGDAKMPSAIQYEINHLDSVLTEIAAEKI
jgi:hypothetical protein